MDACCNLWQPLWRTFGLHVSAVGPVDATEMQNLREQIGSLKEENAALKKKNARLVKAVVGDEQDGDHVEERPAERTTRKPMSPSARLYSAAPQTGATPPTLLKQGTVGWNMVV